MYGCREKETEKEIKVLPFSHKKYEMVLNNNRNKDAKQAKKLLFTKTAMPIKRREREIERGCKSACCLFNSRLL
jgi:ribosomal protein L22